MDWNFDVIIVGAGGAGLAAAIEATKAGASCILLEADTKLGGATALSGGVFYAANTSVQRAAGIADDTADKMFEYIMALNHWKLKPNIIRYICNQSGPTIEWLIGLGAVFPTRWLIPSGVELTPRGHSSEGAGAGIADVLINAAGAASVETALGTRVEKLLHRDGRVVGVHAEGMDLLAPVVILATGGFGNSAEMRRKHFPSAAQHGSWTWAVHDAAPFILGDGITLAEDVGARIVGHDTGLVLPTSGFSKSVEAFLPPWTMIVNEEGVRFMPEMAAYTICGYLINEQTNQHAYAIFDEPTLVEASTDLRFADPYNSGVPSPTWEERTIRQQVAEGRVKTAQSLGELAALCGIDATALAETVAIYNQDCDTGVDTHFLKEAPKMFAIRQAPFFAVEIRPAIIGVTGAGLDIDADCHVLDQHGRQIRGLYAAGEVLGVLQGKRYAGGGMSIGPAVILGRHVGRIAAAEAAVSKERVLVAG